MKVTARADYAVRAVAELARAGGAMTVDGIARAQDLPPRFLENILCELRRAGLVASRRGQAGGYALARPASSITVADVVGAVDGLIETTRRSSPLGALWGAAGAAAEATLAAVSLDDLVSGRAPVTMPGCESPPASTTPSVQPSS
ncbi:MAG TPA: Rrf2 family transcriptional regulator [Solirubrobacteraceae bacterium]